MNNRATPWRRYTLSATLWLAAFIGATFETAIAARAVKDLNDENGDSLQSLRAIGLMTSITLFAFLQAMAFSGRDTVKNCSETIDIIATRKLPQHWPHLSRCQEGFALTTACLNTTLAAGLDFFAAYYFIGKTPEDYAFDEEIHEAWWDRFSLFIGACVAFITIFTEGIETYKTLRHLLAGEKTQYANVISKSISLTLGATLALTGGTEIVLETYGSMKDSKLISISTDSMKLTFLGLCSAKGIGDICFSGIRAREAITRFIEKIGYLIQTRQLPQKTECLAFILSAGSAILVAYPQRALTTTLMTDPKTALPFSSPEWVTTVLSWGVTSRDGVVQTDTLYDYFLASIRKLFCVTPRNLVVNDLDIFDYHALNTPPAAAHNPPQPMIIIPLDLLPSSSPFFLKALPINEEKEYSPPRIPGVEMVYATEEKEGTPVSKIYLNKNRYTFGFSHHPPLAAINSPSLITYLPAPSTPHPHQSPVKH